MKNNWIKVTDRLPNFGDRVLAVESDGYMTICNYIKDSLWTNGEPGFLNEQDEQPSTLFAIAWMPLPEYPTTP